MKIYVKEERSIAETENQAASAHNSGVLSVGRGEGEEELSPFVMQGRSGRVIARRDREKEDTLHLLAR